MRPCPEALRCRRRQSGAALILVVMIAGLLLASNAVSLEAFLLTMRAERRGIDRIVDFHLADTALTLCERRVIAANRRVARSDAVPAGTPPMTVLREAMAARGEPARWRDARAFDAHAPHASRIALPTALVAPRRNLPLVCLVETWADAPGAGQALLLTVRVPAARPDAGNGTWLQSVVMLTARGIQRHWRAVAEPPPPA